MVRRAVVDALRSSLALTDSAAPLGLFCTGSLLARIVFQPLEESSRLYFSSLSAAAAKAPDRGDAERADKESSASPQYSTFEVAPTPDTLRAVASHLRLLLLFYSHLSLIFTCLAPSFTTPLLHLLLGSRWSRTSASPLLRAYALSLPFLAFNGLTEAFFQSVAPPRWIARGSAWLVACAGAFAASVWFLMRVRGWGAEGLVAANCVNLAMRAALSSVFVQSYFAEAREARKDSKEAEGTEATLSPRSWVPRWPTVVAFGAAAWIVRRSEARWQQEEATKGAGLRLTLEHLGVGAVVGVACLAVMCVQVPFAPRAHSPSPVSWPGRALTLRGLPAAPSRTAARSASASQLSGVRRRGRCSRSLVPHERCTRRTAVSERAARSDGEANVAG